MFHERSSPASLCTPRTRVPQRLALHLDELHAEELLVDLEDCGDDLAYGEVLLDFLVVEPELALEQAAPVEPEIVHVELAVERVALCGVLLLLEREQRHALACADRAELLLEVV